MSEKRIVVPFVGSVSADEWTPNPVLDWLCADDCTREDCPIAIRGGMSPFIAGVCVNPHNHGGWFHCPHGPMRNFP